MKKIYALFLSMLAFACLALVPAVQAQYSITDYSIRVVPNAFVDLSGQGTDITEIDNVGLYEYYRVSNEITLPFTFRYINTVTNKIKVEQTGNVIVGGSASWADGANYDYGNYYYYSIYYSQFTYPQYGYGYYASST